LGFSIYVKSILQLGDDPHPVEEPEKQVFPTPYQTERRWTTNGLLLLAAAIWGTAFVAQRSGMEHVGPFTFNAVRFALGGMALLPLRAIRRRRWNPNRQPRVAFGKYSLLGGGLAGLVLFAGASLQQTGLVSTTAGKAGFITGLYIIIVPIMGLLWKRRTGQETWLGVLLALAGLYLLCAPKTLLISKGDVLVLLGAFAWAGHVHIIGWLSPKFDAIQIACTQFLTCSFLSLITASCVETATIPGFRGAAVSILYAGLLSTGVAYTLQVVAQRSAHPSRAAIILSLEAVFAALGGWLVLREMLSVRELFGCGLMLTGVLLSQISGFRKSLLSYIKG